MKDYPYPGRREPAPKIAERQRQAPDALWQGPLTREHPGRVVGCTLFPNTDRGLCVNDAIAQFSIAIPATGLEAPESIIDDGAIHRFSTNGQRGDDLGWYMLHTDGLPAGAFGCWRAGLQSSWCAKSDEVMTAAEREAPRARIREVRK